MKLKSLLPSLKEKKRYLVFEVISKNKISQNQAISSIMQKTRDFIGELGMAKANLSILEHWRNNKGIIKASNKYTDEIKASLTLINKIDNSDVIVRCLGVSGILNKAVSRYMGG